MKCKHCGGEQFIAHQVCRMEILVDGEGDYIDGVHKDISLDIYDSEPAYGPFQCCGCGAEYDVLAEGEDSIDGPLDGWSWEEESEGSAKKDNLCFECDSEFCAYNPDGICKFALIYGRTPVLHDDGCNEFCYKEN